MEGSKVQLVVTATIGYDHIDTHWLDKAGIRWTNCPGCNSGSVAQYVECSLLLLEQQKKLPLSQSTIGIVGCGHVGSKVKAVAERLGMHVLVCDPPLQKANSQKLTANSQKLSIALDGIQDPGNLGTIIRIADWFGITTIYCSEDTADCYNPKVVQATMGSLAHIDIVYTDLEALLRQYDGPIYGTLLDGQNIYQQELSSEGIIVMGNEGNGISPAIRQLVTHKLLIPNYNPSSETAESLNVAIATAITCAEFRRVTVTSNIL